jgi:lactate dehydrogenase-like 2-hydroxyacid dehydrogenase
MSLPRVLICGDIVWAHDEVKEMLGPIAEVVRMDSPNREHFFQHLNSTYANIVGIYRHNTSADRIGIFDAELVNTLPKTVAWIAHNGAGYDQIDIAACKARGIHVSNTPGAVDDATATVALYLIISTTRQFSKAERNVRAGNWKNGLQPAHDPSSLTLGILGYGGIGGRLAELAHAFPMRVIYHNRKPSPNAPSWAKYYANLHDMLKETDVLSVHIPLRAETVDFVGEKEIRSLKKGAIIVNTARGKVIDEAAMIAALKDGHLSAAGLDVYPDEPNITPELFDFPQVTLLPHLGTETQESQKRMEIRALQNLKDFFLEGKGKDIIPECRDMLAKF